MDTNDKKTNESGIPISRRTLIKAAGAGIAGTALAYGIEKYSLPGKNNETHAATAAGEMTYRVNPRNGDRISLLGYGCMRFPVLPEADRPSSPLIDEAAAFKLVDYAIEHGVNYFDTAWMYHGGMSAVVTGKALKRYPRKSYFLADKMPGMLEPTVEKAKEIFNTQLERSQSGYIDYYLLHSLGTIENYQKVYEQNGILKYLLQEKAAGRIRNLGWSFHGEQETLEYVLSRDVDWDCALVQLNYHDIMHEFIPLPSPGQKINRIQAQPKWVLEKMLAANIPMLVMEPLLGGRLARLNKKTLTVLQQERPQSSAASWAFKYVGNIPNVLTVLSGMTYMEHLQDNLKTYSPLEPLTDKELVVLRKALDLFITQETLRCTACSYCMPCPYGVDIPAVFTHYNNCVDDEFIPKGERNANYEAARRAFLVGYDRSVPELRQAMRCTGCNKCTPHCPQKINIPEEMARLGRFAERLRNEV